MNEQAKVKGSKTNDNPPWMKRWIHRFKLDLSGGADCRLKRPWQENTTICCCSLSPLITDHSREVDKNHKGSAISWNLPLYVTSINWTYKHNKKQNKAYLMTWAKANNMKKSAWCSVTNKRLRIWWNSTKKQTNLKFWQTHSLPSLASRMTYQKIKTPFSYH